MLTTQKNKKQCWFSNNSFVLFPCGETRDNEMLKKGIGKQWDIHNTPATLLGTPVVPNKVQYRRSDSTLIKV